MRTRAVVEISDRETGEVVKRLECKTVEDAPRVARGVLINLHRERYMVAIVYEERSKS